MSKKEESSEELITHISNEIKEEHLHEISRNPPALRDVPLKIRKKRLKQFIWFDMSNIF
jgi:hypothetical protein